MILFYELRHSTVPLGKIQIFGGCRGLIHTQLHRPSSDFDKTKDRATSFSFHLFPPSLIRNPKA